MKITFVSVLYPPESEPTSVMAAELAHNWGRAGHDVLVICPFPNRPHGMIHQGFRRRLWQWQQEEHVTVLRVATWFIGHKRRTLDRILENITFGVAAAMALLGTRRGDVILMEAWPILAPLPILAAAFVRRRIPVINYIKDVYPETAVAAGVSSKGGMTERVLLALDAFVCRSSACNIVISEGMERLTRGRRNLPRSAFRIVRDWLDLSRVQPIAGKSMWRAEHGIDEDVFVCMFAGTLGHASRVDVLVEVAERLRGVPQVRIVCVGEGPLKAGMQRAISAAGLKNIALLPFEPLERVGEMQSAADVMLLTTSAEMGLSSVPSKLITYLAVGKPLVCAVARDSDIAELVNSCGLGRVVAPESAIAIAAAILELRAQETVALSEIGNRARDVALRLYSLDAAMKSLDKMLLEVASS